MQCNDVAEIIDHYHLQKLVYSTQSINNDLVSEFYIYIYITHVAKCDLDFTPTYSQKLFRSV